jgi:hypothetical protein
MRSLIVGASIIGLVIGLFVAFADRPNITKEPIKRCRVNKVLVERPYGGITPDITYRLTTDEGYVVFSRNRAFRVGDSIQVQVIRISK